MQLGIFKEVNFGRDKFYAIRLKHGTEWGDDSFVMLFTESEKDKRLGEISIVGITDKMPTGILFPDGMCIESIKCYYFGYLNGSDVKVVHINDKLFALAKARGEEHPDCI